MTTKLTSTIICNPGGFVFPGGLNNQLSVNRGDSVMFTRSGQDPSSVSLTVSVFKNGRPDSSLFGVPSIVVQGGAKQTATVSEHAQGAYDLDLTPDDGRDPMNGTITVNPGQGGD